MPGVEERVKSARAMEKDDSNRYSSDITTRCSYATDELDYKPHYTLYIRFLRVIAALHVQCIMEKRE
jgi:hypothetical protein